MDVTDSELANKDVKVSKYIHQYFEFYILPAELKFILFFRSYHILGTLCLILDLRSVIDIHTMEHKVIFHTNQTANIAAQMETPLE